MGNNIKTAGGGLALQCTRSAREANLVDDEIVESHEGTKLEVSYRADVRVFSFDQLLLVVDFSEMADRDIVELVTTAAEDSGTIYRAGNSILQRAGNGYLVQLPPAEDAGFREGDATYVTTAPNLLLITKSNTSAARAAKRLAEDLIAIRNEQVA